MRAPNPGMALLFVLPLLLWAAPGLCATPVQDDCDWDKVQSIAPATLLHPQLYYESQKPLMESGRWLEVLRAIREDFERSAAPRDENYRRFLRQLEATEAEFKKVTDSLDFERLAKTAENVRLARFRIVKDPDADRVHLFYRQPDQITIDAAMSPEVRRAYCWRALSIGRILTRYGEQARAVTALALQTYVAQWDAYNANGYRQYPWELYLNGKWAYDRDSLAPPRRQWVIAHPGVAVEQAGSSFERSRLDTVVTLEPIGHLWYTEDRKSYYGLAALLTLSSDRDVGRGILLHFGKSAKLGFVWRDRDAQNRRQNGLVFTMDLYQLLTDPPQSQLDSRARVQAILDKVLAAR